MGMKEYAEKHRHNAQFEGLVIQGGVLRRGLKKWPIAECEATLDTGAAVAARMTATRVIGGTVLLGPLGTVLGGLAKKNRSKVYLGIAVPGDAILIEVDSKKEGKARQFLAKFNAAAEQYRAIAESPEPAAIEASQTPAGWYPIEGQLRWWDGSQWTENFAPLPASD